MSPAPTVRQPASHARAHTRLADTDTLAAARCRALAPIWLLLPPRRFHATTGHAPRSNSGPSASLLSAPSWDVNVFICDITIVTKLLIMSHTYYFLRRRSVTLRPVRQPQITRSKVKLPFARRPLLRLDQVSIFEHACRQPFGNQPDNSPVANPMFDETDQPIPVNLVEKGLNVAVEYPVDPPLPDPERERIQRLMLVTLRSETVAEAQELRLIDRRQDCYHRSLDNLVLYGSDAERPLSAIRLRYVLPK